MKVSFHTQRSVNGTAEPQRYAIASAARQPRERTTVRYFSAAMRVLQSLWRHEKRNPAKELRLISGHGIRACERYVSGDRVGGFDVAVNLFFTTEGPEHVEAWRAERRRIGLPVPVWVDDFLAFVHVTNGMRSHDENKKQAEELRRLNDNL